MATGTISTAELDAIARLGLEDLRACFTAQPPDGALDRAELTLKLIRQGTSRYSAENNRVAIGLKVARAVGLSAEEQKPLWKQIVNAPAQIGDGLEQSGDPLKAGAKAAK